MSRLAWLGAGADLAFEGVGPSVEPFSGSVIGFARVSIRFFNVTESRQPL